MSTIKTGTTLTTAYQVVGDTTGALVIQTGSTPTTAMTIDTSQNVGIGTGSPAYKLDLNGSNNSTLMALGNKDSRRNYFKTSAISGYDNALFSIYSDSGVGNFAFENTSGELVRIDSGGNVGIGNTSPAADSRIDARLDNSGSTAWIRIQNQSGTANSKAGFKMSTVNGDWQMYANRSGGFYIDTPSVASAVNINNNGSLLVGTTSYSSGVGSAGFTSIKTASGWFAAGFSGYYGVGINAITATGDLMYFYYNGGASPVGYIRTNGSSTTYATSSDYRLKENVQPMTGALAKVAAMKPCTYTWKSTGAADEGFIAHELQEVCPSAVTGEKDGVEIYVDEDGNEQTRPKYQGIDTSFLVATLTAAIQELNAKVDAQAAEIAALKG